MRSLSTGRLQRRPRQGVRAALCWQRIWRAVLAASSVGAPLGAHALEIEAGVGYELTYSDNVTNEANGISDWEHRPQLSLRATHDSTDYSLAADYVLSHRVYADDTYPEDTTLNGTTSAKVSLVPSVAEWVFSHSSSENPVDSRGADVPDNRQTTTVLATGPDLRFDFGPRLQAELTARFQDVTADRTGNDSTRWVAQGQLRRVIAPGTSLGVRVAHSDIDFDAEFGRDYRTTDGRLTLEREQSARLRFELEVGAVSVKNDAAPIRTQLGVIPGESSDSVDWTGLAKIEYLLPARWIASLSGERRVVDQGSDLGPGVVGFGGAANSRSDQRESYLEERLGVGLERSEGRLRGRLTIDRLIQEYDNERQDEERRRAFVSLDYALGPRLQGQGSASLEEIEFSGIGGTDLRRNLAVRLSYELLQRLNLNLVVEWEDREGDDRNSLSYDETRVTLGAAYRFY